MPRRRSDKSLDWLPKRVYKQGNAYVFIPSNCPAVTLCPVTASNKEVLDRHFEENNKLVNLLKFEKIINDFYLSPDFRVLATKTRDDYSRYREKITAVFAKMEPNSIKPKHIREFMDVMGTKSITQANRHKACMQKICSWAYERGRIAVNPCKGVRKFTEKPRERYITHKEYAGIYKNADDVCKIAMEIAYLCGARIGDIIEMRIEQITEDGIFIKQGKTGRKQIKSWSPRLEAAIASAQELPLNAGRSSIFVIHKTDGDKYSKRGLQKKFEDAKQKSFREMGFKTVDALDIHFHDLKAKAGSDMEGTLAEVSHDLGHTNLKQTLTYRRKTEIVASVQNPAPIH